MDQVVCANGCSTGTVQVVVLTWPRELAYLAVGRDADMGGIEDEDVPVIWYMMSVGLVARSAHERYAAEPTHVEALSPLIR